MKRERLQNDAWTCPRNTRKGTEKNRQEFGEKQWLFTGGICSIDLLIPSFRVFREQLIT